MAALESTTHGPDHTGHGAESSAERVIDPVCGMTVDPATARHRAEHAGREYFFCGPRCRERFVEEPERFLGGKEAAP
jgi:Cu+-exporting ATPase